MKDIKMCFSEKNFDFVYKYIAERIDKNAIYKYSDSNGIEYHLFLKDKVTITLKDKQNWTLAVISKEKGIFSMAIWNGKRIEKKSNEIFCSILLKSEIKSEI